MDRDKCERMTTKLQFHNNLLLRVNLKEKRGKITCALLPKKRKSTALKIFKNPIAFINFIFFHYTKTLGRISKGKG